MMERGLALDSCPLICTYVQDMLYSLEINGKSNSNKFSEVHTKLVAVVCLIPGLLCCLLGTSHCLPGENPKCLGSSQSLFSFAFHWISSFSLYEFAQAEGRVCFTLFSLACRCLSSSQVHMGVLCVCVSVSAFPLEDSGYIKLRFISMTLF